MLRSWEELQEAIRDNCRTIVVLEPMLKSEWLALIRLLRYCESESKSPIDIPLIDEANVSKKPHRITISEVDCLSINILILMDDLEEMASLFELPEDEIMILDDAFRSLQKMIPAIHFSADVLGQEHEEKTNL